MTHTSFSSLMKCLAVSALLAISVNAHAQELQPSQDQLALPASEAPAVATTETAVPQTSAPTGGKASDPCPAPTAAATNNPDDLAKVQEEIDRFTLCVQRAQLLERLNESTLRNVQAGDAALGLLPPGGAMMPGTANAQVAGGMPGLAPLPEAALAGADVSPLQQGATAPSGDAAETAKAQEPEVPKDWTIKEIFGNGNDMQARLLSPEGDEVKARNGMKLPEGPTIVRISPSGVTVRDGGNTKSLEWARS